MARLSKRTYPTDPSRPLAAATLPYITIKIPFKAPERLTKAFSD